MSFRIAIDEHVRQVLTRVPLEERPLLEERLRQVLGELASLASLRRWAALSEEGDRMQVEVRTRRRYLGVYSVDYGALTLTLHTLAEQPDPDGAAASPPAGRPGAGRARGGGRTPPPGAGELPPRPRLTGRSRRS